MTAETDSSFTPARPTSAAPEFPWRAQTVCYFISADGDLEQLRFADDRREAVRRAWLDPEVKLFAVWPGQYRSDLFRVDNIPVMAAAFKIALPDG